MALRIQHKLPWNKISDQPRNLSMFPLNKHPILQKLPNFYPMSHQVSSSIGFLCRDPLYKTEKPYTLRYPTSEGTPRENIKLEKCPLTIFNAFSTATSLETCGFCSIELPTRMSYDDFSDATKIESVYAPETADYLERLLGARHVYVIDYNVHTSSNPPSEAWLIEIDTEET